MSIMTDMVILSQYPIEKVGYLHTYTYIQPM